MSNLVISKNQPSNAVVKNTNRPTFPKEMQVLKFSLLIFEDPKYEYIKTNQNQFKGNILIQM